MEQRGRKRAQTFRARCPRKRRNEPKNSCQPLRLFALRAAWLEAVAALGRGKTVEQLLSAESHEGQPAVRWVSVYPHDGTSSSDCTTCLIRAIRSSSTSPSSLR